MTGRPPYVVHTVEEKDIVVDWFFGRGHRGTTVRQLVLILLGWFFAVLPVVITASALLHRNDPDQGWWGYHEGFVMWEVTMVFLSILFVLFVVGFLALHLIDRAAARDRARRATYDEGRLEQRLEIAETWYADKFGPADLRRQQRSVVIQPHGDIETYELRGLYRNLGAE